MKQIESALRAQYRIKLREYEAAHKIWMDTPFFDPRRIDIAKALDIARTAYIQAVGDWESTGRPD